jgi:hypothetical protein
VLKIAWQWRKMAKFEFGFFLPGKFELKFRSSRMFSIKIKQERRKFLKNLKEK